MKKLFLLFVVLLVSAILRAQNQDVKFYGVDFTHTKVLGAKESFEQFTKAFVGINELLIAESDKYDFSRVVRQITQSNVNTDIDMMRQLIKSTDYSNLIIYKNYKNERQNVNVSAIISDYPLKEEKGQGLVVIATLLDKSKAKAFYNVVLFDIETREIVALNELSTSAGGIGLRNFWASSVYRLTSKCKLTHQF